MRMNPEISPINQSRASTNTRNGISEYMQTLWNYGGMECGDDNQ